MSGLQLVYLFATIVGWPLIFVMLFFGGDADADLDVDLDLDVELDTDLDLDFDGGGGFGEVVSSMFSVRSMVFFLAFFGAIGLVFSLAGSSTVVALVSAIGVGLFGAYFNGWLTRFLKRSSMSSEFSKNELEGVTGRVTVPIDPGHKGRIAIDVGGQPLNVVATPFSRAAADQFQVGDEVVVIEIDERGTALIARLDQLGYEQG